MGKDYQLYKISAQIEALLEQAEGTIDPETGEIKENPKVWECLAELLEQQNTLIEDVVKEVLNREHLINGLKEQEMKLNKRRKEHERVVERLKNILAKVVKRKGGKVKVGMYHLHIRRSQKVEIINPDALPDEVDGVPIIKVERKPIKSAILKLWKQGKAIMGAEIKEKESAVIRVR